MQTILHDLTEYLEFKKSYLRDDSYKVYRNFSEKLTVFLKLNSWDQLPAKKFTPAMCEAYRKYILKKHKDPTTRNKEIGQFKMFWKQLCKPGWDRAKYNPAAQLELLPKVESDMHEPYTRAEVEAITAAIMKKGDLYLLLYIYLIHYTFSRPGKEVRLLKVGDIKSKVVTIKPENSKTGRMKTPTITKPLEELITKLGVRNYPSNFYVFGEEGVPGLVPVGKGRFYHRHKKILTDLGIKGKKTIYSYKHTGNVFAVELGISDNALQQQNGFKERRTLEIYRRKLSAYANDEIYNKFV